MNKIVTKILHISEVTQTMLGWLIIGPTASYSKFIIPVMYVCQKNMKIGCHCIC